MPAVTVYIPTKNRVQLLQRAVTSVQAQTMSDWELIIVDDGSTDGTFEYLTAVTKSDPRVHMLRNETSIGACASRNRAIELAAAPLVTGLDDDDEFLPERLEVMLANYNDEYAFVCTSLYWVTHNSRKVILDGEQILTLRSELGRNHTGNQVLVRKERLLSIGGFDSDFPALQDYDCFVRLIEAYGPAKRIGLPLMNIYVAHGHERISSGPKAVDGYDVFRKKHGYKMSLRQRFNHYLQVLARKGFSRSLRYRIMLMILSISYVRKKHEF
ncbi:glycosyl transferase [Pseudidiomarina aquimaris]|uniref:Glycosyl transferase n=1 Tax=Pseudidiomarina aquimaris TaxID=641841 RepID=A0A432XDB3_9GAMM|nr:glycosyltransferase [Pseudidiomarina aquimaris]RUO46642.1 glycosyl transferase [Pseudidiomarina aquimaris]